MKILRVLICCLFLATPAFSISSDWWVNCSSALTNISTGNIVVNTLPGTILGSVVVSTRSGVAAFLSIYDSSVSLTTPIDVIDLSSGQPFGFHLRNKTDYNYRISSGITVSKTDATSRVFLFWHNPIGKCQ